jgi:hypothetical protein
VDKRELNLINTAQSNFRYFQRPDIRLYQFEI